MYSNELAHHGILGMKWGVRRYQNKDGSLTAAGRERYSPNMRYKGQDKQENKASERDHSQSNKSPLAWFATSAALDILYLNPVGLAQDSARLIQAGSSFVKNKKYSKERDTNPIDKTTGFHKKSREMTVKEDASRVNPSVYNFDKNTKNNCMLCTSAYDLRRRGYDVQANKASTGYSETDIKYWYPKAQLKHISGVNEKGKPSRKDMMTKVKSELVQQGDGARGNLMITWANTFGGHSVAYEVQNGKLRIVDAQVNKIYDDPDKFLRRCSSNVTYARLDNVNFNKHNIREVAN